MIDRITGSAAKANVGGSNTQTLKEHSKVTAGAQRANIAEGQVVSGRLLRIRHAVRDVMKQCLERGRRIGFKDRATHSHVQVVIHGHV